MLGTSNTVWATVPVRAVLAISPATCGIADQSLFVILSPAFERNVSQFSTAYLAFHPQESQEGPTASCLCFVIPDGQRTMRTCLGASEHLSSASMLPSGWTDNAVLLHCEGYCLYRPQLAREAMTAAKQAGALVSIDLASFECVANCKAALLELLQDGLLDLVFANEEEAFALLEAVGQQVPPGGEQTRAQAVAPVLLAEDI
eukprot:GHUV01044144.1.p1 GENE.GHUV01044144.1~~GHUV01044144.1.p1  ORF type:complete len:202 (-),score=51.57 GHUV01044144.1:25-630(-)